MSLPFAARSKRPWGSSKNEQGEGQKVRMAEPDASPNPTDTLSHQFLAPNTTAARSEQADLQKAARTTRRSAMQEAEKAEGAMGEQMNTGQTSASTESTLRDIYLT